MMKFNKQNQVTVFQAHTQKVTNIGIPANAAKATAAFKDLDVFRTYMIEEFGNGSTKEYAPLVEVSVDKDGYISFEPTRDDINDFFDRLPKYDWTNMDETNLVLARFETVNFFNADAQVVIDDNKKLTGFKSQAQIKTVKLLGMQKLDFMVNLDGTITNEIVRSMNDKISYGGQKWMFVGDRKALVVKVNAAEESYIESGITYVADPEHIVRLSVINNIKDTMDKLAEQYEMVQYNARDSKTVKEIRGGKENNSEKIAANIIRSLFGEYYGNVIFQEEMQKDAFNKENEDSNVNDSFIALEMAAELANAKKKAFETIRNFTFNALEDLTEEEFAATVLLAAKRGDLNTAGGSTFFTTLFEKHAYLATKFFSVKEESGEYRELKAANYAGEKIQVFNNEVFEDGQVVNLINSTEIEGFESRVIKPMIFKGAKPTLMVKYFDDKAYLVYDLFEALKAAIAEEKAEAASKKQFALSVDFDRAYVSYNKDAAKIEYGEDNETAEEIVNKINAFVAEDAEFVLQMELGEYHLFVKEGDDLKYICDINTQRGKDFGAGTLKRYLNKKVVKIDEVHLGVIGKKANNPKGQLSLVFMGNVVADFEGEIPDQEDIVEAEFAYSEEVKSAIIPKAKKEAGQLFGNIFGKLEIKVEEEVAEEDNEPTVATLTEDEDALGEEFEDEDGFYGDDEDEEYEAEFDIER